MRRRLFGLLAFIAAAVWPLISPYFWEFFREVIIYEEASKLLHLLMDKIPLDLIERFGPSLLLVGVGFYLFQKTAKDPVNSLEAATNKDQKVSISLPDNRQWLSSYNIFELADQKLMKAAIDSEEEVERITRAIDDYREQRRMLAPNDRFSGTIPLNVPESDPLRALAESAAAAHTRMVAVQQQRSTARAQALADIYVKLRSGELVAKGFLHPIRRTSSEREIPAAQWRIIKFNGDYTEAQGQSIKYSGVAVARAL